jgi:hypothetical protein
VDLQAKEFRNLYPNGYNKIRSNSSCWQTLRMDELTAGLEALSRRYAEAFEQRQNDGVKLATQFQEELRFLIAIYGWPAGRSGYRRASGGGNAAAIFV